MYKVYEKNGHVLEKERKKGNQIKKPKPKRKPSKINIENQKGTSPHTKGNATVALTVCDE